MALPREVMLGRACVLGEADEVLGTGLVIVCLEGLCLDILCGDVEAVRCGIVTTIRVELPRVHYVGPAPVRPSLSVGDTLHLNELTMELTHMPERL